DDELAYSGARIASGSDNRLVNQVLKHQQLSAKS
ncbi:hypothetical protein Tco_1461426, partial [Tanacetum coccineum]